VESDFSIKRVKSLLVRSLLLVLFALLQPSVLWADGFRNPFQSAAAIGQGNAFAAQAEDASAVFYNPAGMAQLRGVQHIGGVQLVNVDTHFRGLNGRTTKNDLGGPFGLPPPAQFFLTANVKDLGIERLGDLSIGFGLQNLFGFASRYPENGPLNTAVIEASLPLLDIKPTFAYRLTDWLSVGGGVDIFTFWTGFVGGAEQKFISPGLPGIPAGSRVRITGDGTVVGGNASFLLTPLRTSDGAPRINLGFVWRSQADLPLNGNLYVNGRKVAKSKSGLHFPDIYTTAIAFWPLRNREREWKLETDVDYVRWSTIKIQTFRFSNGITLRIPQTWHNAVSVNTGTEYKWIGLPKFPRWDLALRAGYIWSRTPVSDRNFTPAFPDSNGHVLSAGIGLTCKPGGKFLGLISCGEPGKASNWRYTALDLAYQAILWETRRVTKSPNPAVNGRYRSLTQALSLSLRFAF
jgi:long-chain fatty acid transport protein